MAKRESNSDFDGEFDDESNRELIDAEFESIVEGLSLDQSSPTTYLDELDAFEDNNRFTPPPIPKKGFRAELRSAIRAISRWKNNPHNEHPEDGAAL